MKIKAERKLIIISFAFLAFTVFAMVVNSQESGQTRVQAAEAHAAMEVKCAAAKASGAGAIERLTACMPPELKRPGTWTMGGLLALGSFMVSAALACAAARKD